MIENGIKPVFVFDGKPPGFKAKEIERRKEAKKEAERKAEAERIERERQEREAAEAKRRAELVARLAQMTAEDIARWIASELGCSAAVVAARLAEIPREDWLALTQEGAK